MVVDMQFDEHKFAMVEEMGVVVGESVLGGVGATIVAVLILILVAIEVKTIDTAEDNIVAS